MRIIGSVLSLAVLLWASSLSAQPVPRMINYQGQLLDASGKALTDSDYKLTFAIYNLPTGGVPLWGGQVFDGNPGLGHGPLVPLVGGRFNVALGDVDTNNISITNALYTASRYFLEIQIGSNAPIAP